MKKTVRDIDVKGRKVIERCDFNVPMADGKITDDTRITSSLPTINYLLDQGAAVILMSHMGRPKGKADMNYTLKPVADRLSALLGRQVMFISSPDVVDDRVKAAAAALKPGQECSLRMSVSEKKKQTTIRGLQKNWLPWLIFMSMTLLARLTGLMPPPQE